jgi:elongation factor Ts
MAMAEITAASVKELRERTGAGMMDCKKALAETNGEMEAAIDWLRAKGLSAAAKKAGRTAAEGLVGAAIEGNRGALIEVNSETDFVAKNEIFQDFVRNAAELVLQHGTDMGALGAAQYPGGGTVQEKLTDNIAKIGENQSLRRAAVLEVGQGAVVSYVHNQVAPGLGKIGVLVALESAAPAATLNELGRQIAQHVAAAHPQALDADSLDPELVERERSIALEKAKESGKPQNIIEKMVEGGLAKFRKENALLTQLFVRDNKTPVAEVISSAAKEADAGIELVGFVRFQLGEGIEKKVDDFAAEVAAASGVKKNPEQTGNPEPVA